MRGGAKKVQGLCFEKNGNQKTFTVRDGSIWREGLDEDGHNPAKVDPHLETKQCRH